MRPFSIPFRTHTFLKGDFGLFWEWLEGFPSSPILWKGFPFWFFSGWLRGPLGHYWSRILFPFYFGKGFSGRGAKRGRFPFPPSRFGGPSWIPLVGSDLVKGLFGWGPLFLGLNPFGFLGTFGNGFLGLRKGFSPFSQLGPIFVAEGLKSVFGPFQGYKIWGEPLFMGATFFRRV